MCQSKAQGGKRCDHDTSENRRLRRKAAKLRVTTSAKTANPIAPQPLTAGLVSPSIARLKQEAEQLRKDIHNAPKDPVKRSAYDARMEKKLTKLGMSIGEEADKIANISEEETQAEVEAIEEEIVGDLKRKLQKMSDEQNDRYDQWAKISHKFDSGSRFTPEESALDETDIEEEKQLIQDIFDTSEELNELRSEESQATAELNTHLNEIRDRNLSKLKDAYREIIAQIRPLGGTTQWHEKSDPDAVEVINETINKDYPSEWLAYHNDPKQARVILGVTGDRPAYITGELSETETDDIPKLQTDYCILKDLKDEEFAQLTENLSKIEGVKFQEFSSTSYRSPEPSSGLAFEFQEVTAYDESEHGPMVDGKPQGDAWEHTVALTNVNQVLRQEGAAGLIKLSETKQWVTKGYSNRKFEDVLLVREYDEGHNDVFGDSDVENTFENDNKAVAYHEFGHRMEHVFPENLLARQEKAFLKRRTGKTDETFNSNLKVTLGEFLQTNGKFVGNYTGRMYFRETSYEVFTTGIESVYGKRQGGLIGHSRNSLDKDLDHRGFTLGALATL
jgi:hypothetical protein